MKLNLVGNYLCLWFCLILGYVGVYSLCGLCDMALSWVCV